ncbi:uncharacterized protein M421DRAFT_421424 [Didymella exigua CBS 183.55]|uniref:Uncharacterized protein n=1 Tax=Didymella exigua CBS 183.55 TaxID=1150837 RepID=A0A6A5RIE3_9PLEO|nr:uncharacterized protein M421DRAFT_421424 [Didymella exigua CBS 183.55]KAF1927582.1 hypothetical protein M421DRAFT_421424 [Didymella exigua CBS 183.55]
MSSSPQLNTNTFNSAPHIVARSSSTNSFPETSKSHAHTSTTTLHILSPYPAMAQPQLTILTPEQRLTQENAQRYTRILRNVAIGGVVICPIIMLMPPRKLDLYTFSLGLGFYLSADHLCESYYGRGLVTQLSPFRAAADLPTERAREVQAKIREAREEERRKLGTKEQGEGVLTKIWMGGESEGWKERRLEEEKKAIEEGKSFSDMIFEQIWDVWNWDKKGKGDGEKKE